MDEEGNVLNEWYGRTVICSNRRFTYEEAQEILDTETGDYAEELLLMNRIAKKMRKDRFKKGAIGFNKTEVKFRLDDKGNPYGIFFKISKDSNNLIEEFMLLANKKVAELIGKSGSADKRRPFVYRIHDSPNEEKIGQFSEFIKRFGYRLNAKSDKELAGSLNKLLNDVKGKKEENIVEQLAIRSMSKAVYTTDNIGHYGLAFPFYTHFTSPIRRYPDVMVHRLLQDFLDKIKPEDEEALEMRCRHSSEMEKKAAEAERASIKYKQVQFLEDKIGENFEAVISGVTEWGIYVEIIDNKCEGMIRLRDLKDDFYEFDEDNYCLKGRKAGHILQLGDKLLIQVKKADLVKKQLDFVMIKRPEELE
jgi:ribonuclease R